jgi:hypothetical protein
MKEKMVLKFSQFEKNYFSLWVLKYDKSMSKYPDFNCIHTRN